MIGHMNDAALAAMIVAAEEIIFRWSRKMRGSMIAVFVPADIHRLVIICRGISPLCNWVCHRGPPQGIMVVNIAHIRRKHKLIIIIDRDSRILPHQEAMAKRSAVDDMDAGLKKSCIASEHDTDCGTGTVGRITLGKPGDCSAVRLSLDGIIDRHISRWTVMKGPVEFKSARNPQAICADQSRLDNMLTVKEIIMIDLIIGFEYTPA